MPRYSECPSEICPQYPPSTFQAWLSPANSSVMMIRFCAYTSSRIGSGSTHQPHQHHRPHQDQRPARRRLREIPGEFVSIHQSFPNRPRGRTISTTRYTANIPTCFRLGSRISAVSGLHLPDHDPRHQRPQDRAEPPSATVT